MAQVELEDRSRYKYFTPVTLRYGDTDSLGHINNAVFTTLLESGRAALLFDRQGAIAGPGKTFVIVALSVHFKAEMHYPGMAEIATCLLGFGRTSVRIGQAIYKDQVCCATSESTIVLIDETTRKPTEIDSDLKRIIEQAEGRHSEERHSE